ncbi:hypothetical protein [Pseudonocardia sp. GCM10023141]
MSYPDPPPPPPPGGWRPLRPQRGIRLRSGSIVLAVFLLVVVGAGA